jgi:hypothetical protein
LLIKEVWVGPEKAYTCKISRQLFGANEYGGSEAARRAALHCACEIIREQTRNGVQAGTSIRQRRRIYQSECESRCPSLGVKSVVSFYES